MANEENLAEPKSSSGGLAIGLNAEMLEQFPFRNANEENY